MPDSCNWIYVIGKGFLRHGWFGRVHDVPVSGSQTSGFDPVTGADVPGQPSPSTSPQAGSAIAYAVARGDFAKIESLFGPALGTYMGMIA